MDLSWLLLLLQAAPAAAKGCFLPHVEVSMADGSIKALRDIQVGDAVLSWDEVSQHHASSIVQAVPSFSRPAWELVEVCLASVCFQATEDHPFWSRGKSSLVSAKPERTAAEYGLTAELFEEGEELDGFNGSGVTASWGAVTGRRLGESMSVATLCLEPLHWFYVHGVRVHNKGCFAPWVKVLLSNGSEAPIASVSIGDHVASWDEETERRVEAEVLEVEFFPPRELMEMRAGNHTLVLTSDHPVYSARKQGLVSMRPGETLANYGMSVAQMLKAELVQNESGGAMAAAVWTYRGALPPRVVTLHLARSHWFFAEGVRVHNKGFGGSSFHASIGSSSDDDDYYVSSGRRRYDSSRRRFDNLLDSRRRRTGNGRSDFNTDLAFAVFILAHDRKHACQANRVRGLRDYKCRTYMGGDSSDCESCDTCTDKECVKGIPGCAAFLSDIYRECEKILTPAEQVGAFAFWLLLCVFCVLWVRNCCLNCNSNPESTGKVQDKMSVASYTVLNEQKAPASATVVSKQQERKAMTPMNGPGLGATMWTGHYYENGDRNRTTYEWTADSTGFIKGSSADDDGPATVVGAITWHLGQASGRIAWREEWAKGGVVVEAAGTISKNGELMKIEANYYSSLHVSGQVCLEEISQE